jgi:hypothetical protein
MSPPIRTSFNTWRTAIDPAIASPLQTYQAIYFDSDSDFSNESIAESYLVWQAASEFEE